MSRRRTALALMGGLACFGLGLAAARLVGSTGGPATLPPQPAEPRIVFDPGSIDLLPDASLHLDLPRGFDAGSP